MKKALIIGIDDYTNLEKLNKCVEDSKELEKNLESVGYQVTSLYDIDFIEVLREIQKFEDEITEGDQLLIYYSGHGMNINGENIVSAKDSIRIQDVPNSYETALFLEIQKYININRFYEVFNTNKSGQNLLIVDACRDSNNFKDLQEEEQISSNSISIYSTLKGRTANDGRFMEALSHCFFRLDQDIDKLHKSIKLYLKYNTDKKQETIMINNSTSEYYLFEINHMSEYAWKKYYENINYIYKTIDDSYDMKKEYTVEYVLTETNYYLYYEESLLREYIERFIHSERTGLGYIGFIMMNNEYTIIDFYEKNFVIGIQGIRISFENENYFEVIDFIQLIKNKSIEIIKNEIYEIKVKSKVIRIIISTYPELMKGLSFQIVSNNRINTYQNILEKTLFYFDQEKEREIIDTTIKKYLKMNKNIGIVGTYDVDKASILESLSTFFTLENSLVVEKMESINIVNGQVTKFDINYCELDRVEITEEMIGKYSDKKYDRLIIPLNYSLIQNSKLVNENINKISTLNYKKIIMLVDHVIERFVESVLLNDYDDRSLRKLSKTLDLIISFEHTRILGTILKSIEIIHEDSVEVIFDLNDNDYSLGLGKLNI